MQLELFFREVGGTYEAVADRFPTVEMIRKFICKFPKDPSYTELKKALEQADLYAAFLAAHTLKGTAANLGLEKLTVAASALTEALRNATILPPNTLVEAVDAAYQLTIEKIEQLMA